MQTRPHAVVGTSLPHESAHLHVTGTAPYTDDLPEQRGTLHAAFGLSERAHARIVSMDLSAVRSAPGVVAVATLDDIPGDKYLGPFLHDEPLFADGTTLFMGQPLFVVAADSHDAARRAVRRVKVEYEDLTPVLDVATGAAQESYVLPPVRVTRGDVPRALQEAPFRHQGEFYCGGQEQFYLEGQIAYAIPGENQEMQVFCSTQHPSEMQQMVSHLLHLPAHCVRVQCRRMGGGFGGKESQSWYFATAAALLAHKTGRPIKLRADRDDDFMITGRRHDFHVSFDVAYDETGLIRAVAFEQWLRCGCSADLSGAVADRQVFHSDNAYYLDAVDIRSLRVKTNTQSNTAFRGFGGPQGIICIEYVIEDIARRLGLDPLDVRFRNFYGKTERNETPYQMKLEDNVMPELMAQIEQTSQYRQRRQAVQDFNAQNKVLKKGICLMPVKFGISFTATHLNQAGALVHVYTDGSVLVNHGGTEMGQGLNTKVAQVVAEEFGLPLSSVRASATDTGKIANTSATAASTGTDLNGKAAQIAARNVTRALIDFAADHFGCDAHDVHFRNGKVQCGEEEFAFADFVRQAYMARIPLWSSGFYRTPKIHYDVKTLTGRPFYYFVYAAACAEVIIDTLTGENRLLRADILYDAGRPINPAVDYGQVEGGFIQGVGWMTTEELYWDAKGRLMTHAPSTYKIPSVSDCPPELNIAFFDNGNRENSIYQSKALGEPPLPLGIAVFLALRDAVSSLAPDGKLVPMSSPATAECVLNALDAAAPDRFALAPQEQERELAEAVQARAADAGNEEGDEGDDRDDDDRAEPISAAMGG